MFYGIGSRPMFLSFQLIYVTQKGKVKQVVRWVNATVNN